MVVEARWAPVWSVGVLVFCHAALCAEQSGARTRLLLLLLLWVRSVPRQGDVAENVSTFLGLLQRREGSRARSCTVLKL